MNLPYDPAENERFWNQIRRLPGFPQQDEIPLKKMIFESDALMKMPSLLQEQGIQTGKPLLVVMDPTPMRRKNESLKPLVLNVLSQAGYEARQLVLEPDQSGQVHTDMPHIEAVKSQLDPDIAVVSVGSGVVTDITKHACYLYEQDGGPKLPFVVYQTANSVSAYTSNMAPVFVQGVKRTLASRYPDLLICDLETLMDAPLEMTAAGVGDLLAAFVAFPDWYLAYQLGMDDHYTDLPQRLMGPLDEILLDAADDIRQPGPEGMAVLAKLISLGGLAMSLSHATTPMSGYEHVISHVLDMIQEYRESPLTQHGSQVALAAVLSSHTYRDFLQKFDPQKVNLERSFPSAMEMHRRIADTFDEIDPSGKAGEECWSDYSQKLERWGHCRESIQAFLNDWTGQREILQSMTRPPERIREILEKTAGPLRFSELNPPICEDDARFAYFNAPLMRKRLTLGDLLIFFEWDRERLWREFQEMGVL